VPVHTYEAPIDVDAASSRRRLRLAALFALTLGACNGRQGCAEKRLTSAGFTSAELRVTPESGVFAFTAVRVDQRCTGTVSTSLFGGVTSECFLYADVCHQTTPTDPAAERIFADGCKAKVPECCVDRGNWIHGTDDTEAMADFQFACDAGNPWGCNNLAVIYQADAATALQAIELFQQACDSGTLEYACAELAHAYEAGIGTAPNLTKAREIYQGACDDHSRAGCSGFASMLIHGEGGPEDKPNGIAILTKDCSHEVGAACRSLAVFARQGAIADPDKKFAEWAEKACRLNDAAGCDEVGTALQGGLQGYPKDAQGAVRAFEKACALNDAAGCLFAGDIAKSGDAGSVNQDAIAMIYRKACELGSKDGCARLASPK
jgi:TPR repeat protein